MPEPPSRRTWVKVAWIGAVVATVLNGVVVGYGAIWFQLFGDTADSEDYLVSAGGYGAGAVVLALAVPAILTHRAPQWLVWPVTFAAAGFGLFAANSVLASASAEAASVPIDNAWDGVGGVIWAPWTWVLIALGLRGVHRLVRAPTDVVRHRATGTHGDPPTAS